MKIHSTQTIPLKRGEKTYFASFYLMSNALPALLEQLPVLHIREKKYFDTLKFDKRKSSYLLGRVAAKKAVAHLTGVKDLSTIFIDSGVFQFPVVKGPDINNIQVSIAHCGDLGIALAFPEDHPLGIDLEKVDAERAEAVKPLISGAEKDMLSACGIPDEMGFILLWTIKEALSKILRTGLTIDVQLLELASLHREDHGFISTFRHFTQYKAISYFSNDYICSITLPKNTVPDLTNFRKAFTDLVTE